MEMGEFNSDDHYIYYWGQETPRRNGVALIINKSPKYSTWVQPQKWQNDLGLFTRQVIQHHSNTNLCSYHQRRRNCSWSVMWRPTRPLRTNTKERSSINHWGLECRSKKSRYPVTGKCGFGEQNEAGQRLTEFCQENALVIANTPFQQHKIWLYTWK